MYNRQVAIALHDVAPATWRACERMIELVETSAGAVPLTLLVVPHYHHRETIESSREFRRGIERRLERGDELALHGYFHLDDGPPPKTPAAWFRRRLLTASEGEFAALDTRTARERIAAGLAMLRRVGWSARGFVPPAWLHAPGGEQTLAGFGFEYTTTRSSLIRLADGRHIPSFAVSLSSRHAFDRYATARLAPLLARLLDARPLLRLALHPVDASGPFARSTWAAVLRRVTKDREAVTKGVAAAADLATASARA